MATRQHSSSGKPKSPRIQVVLPEELFEKLNLLADKESRTISNMAKVLIQEGIRKHESKAISEKSTEQFISTLEAQQTRRLRGVPRRLKLFKP